MPPAAAVGKVESVLSRAPRSRVGLQEQRSSAASRLRLRVSLTFAILVVFCAVPAWAQREIHVRTVVDGQVPYVSTVIAPLARFATVSDVADRLIVSHRPKHPVHLSAFKFDPQGQPISAEPVEWTLPKPAALADRANFALAIVCHPRFPLLYVWQDVEAPPVDAPIPATTSAEFDHLLIYSLEESPPRLLMATARGDSYHCGTNAGALHFDPATSRLYIPNMQQLGGPTKKLMVPAIGWIRIAPDGLPEPAPAPDAPPVPAATAAAPPPVLDPAAAAASRAARLAAGIPTLNRYLESATVTLSDWPVPYSYAPVSSDSVLIASHSGPASWHLNDRLGRFGYFFLNPYVPYRHRIGAHPTLPLIYSILLTYDGRIVRLEHADGYYTMLPQTLIMDNQVIHSAPLVLPKTSQVAVGAAYRVCLVKLDAAGKLLPEVQGVAVNSAQVEAIAWSEKLGRLYAAAEKTP